MTEGEQIVQNLGSASRNLQRWLRQQRQTANSSADALSGAWGVELVARTFAAAPQESREILQGVLDLIGEENFPIPPLLRLTTHLDKIWPSDPEFAAHVYAAIYGHDETSRAQMQLGSPIMPLTIGRRDEYHSCQYQLQQHLPNFLRAQPSLATRAVLNVLNQSVMREHVTPYQHEGFTNEELTRAFQFHGRSASYTPDDSHIWDEGLFPDDRTSMMDDLCKFITELATQERLTELGNVLDVWAQCAGTAFLWRRLLRCAAAQPSVFASHLFELCVARPIQIGGETIYELGEFIAAVAPFQSDDKIVALEKSWFELVDASPEGEEKDQRKRLRDRLLMCIPLHRLQTVLARDLHQQIVAAGQASKNTPLATFFSEVEPYDLGKMLEEAGVDLATPDNAQLRQWLDELSTFSTAWQNKRPTEADVEAILPTAKRVVEALPNFPVEESVWKIAKTTGATCAAAMSRGISNAGTEAFAFCRQFLLACAETSALLQRVDIDQTAPVRAWSPSPQTEAAEGLPWLMRLIPDPEMLAAITVLATASTPAVRFNTVSELFRLSEVVSEAFWSLCARIARDERNPSVQLALCRSLSHLPPHAEEKATEVLTELTNHANLDGGDAQLGENLTALAVWWKLERDNSWARSFLSDLLREPIRHAVPIKQAVHQALNFANPRAFSSADIGTRMKAERSLD